MMKGVGVEVFSMGECLGRGKHGFAGTQRHAAEALNCIGMESGRHARISSSMKGLVNYAKAFELSEKRKP